MTKKFVALTMVLVLAAGVMAIAADDSSDTLTGKWETNLYLMPEYSVFWASSELNNTYTSGGITFKNNSLFADSGFVESEFAVSTSMGMVDISSTANFDPMSPSLDYWGSEVSLTLGGVNLSDYFLLQDTSTNDFIIKGGFGAGNKISISGETPGGISVTVDNYLGMEPLDDGVGTFTGWSYGSFVGYNPHGDYKYGSGYAILTTHDTQTSSQNPYSPSTMQYVGTKLSLENMSLGCCDFSNTTYFSEIGEGFISSEFEFSMESENLPLTLDADLTFTTDSKDWEITPSISTDWACFDLYTTVNNTLTSGETVDDALLESIQVVGFSLTDVKLGDVKVSFWTALGDNTLSTDPMDAPLPIEPWGSDVTQPEWTDYEQLLRIEKLDKFDLSFTLDTYFDMDEWTGDSLFDLGLFQLQADYKLSDQFSIGSGVWIELGANDPTENDSIYSVDFTYSW